ncbi:MAG: hypothetical protein KC432_17330, partial [Thermomicrobiales bacterium]|nr:hypothetical protein [Thermomicrobiales bacterium]
QPGVPWDFQALSDVELQLGRRARVVNWFQGWGDPGRDPDPARWKVVSDRGAIPLITWEPWDWTAGVAQVAYLPRTIAAGQHDAFIRMWATSVRDYGLPVLLRFAHEMNGSWYPWANGINGNTAADYVAAWRRVVQIFRTTGAYNAGWVWCPTIEAAGITPLEACYPGDDVVDLVGFDAYNGGSALSWGGWLTFDQLFGPSLRKLASFSTRPPMVGETASTESGGDKAAWITDMLTTQLTTAYPEIRAFVWFNEAKETDWRIGSSAESVNAMRTGLAANRFAA